MVSDNSFTGVAVALSPLTVHLCVGGRSSSATACATAAGFVGDIDEVRISNTARYTAEVAGVPSEAFTADANTTALFHFNDNAGVTTAVANSAGSSTYTGNITGASWATRTAPTYNYSYSTSTGNNVVAVAPSSDGVALFTAVNNSEAGRSAVMLLYLPNGTDGQIAETINATSNPALVSERI